MRFSRAYTIGGMSFDELASHGDLGIGCGERLDGELIRVGGRAYPVAGNATTPFAATTFFDPDIEIAVEKPMTLPDLENRVRDEFPSENYFYAIRVDGTFSQVVTRSVPAQEKTLPTSRAGDSKPGGLFLQEYHRDRRRVLVTRTGKRCQRPRLPPAFLTAPPAVTSSI
ncbi:MAG: acetolactate decarboxylase [Methanomicrobiaceae archaeon]|nr:acetolactate decarboxylase [Methanomicrobiaceae archaeon]